MKKLVALLAVLAMVNVASAGYTPVGTLTGEVYDFGGVTFNEWVVNLSADNGGIAAIDGQFNAPAGGFLQQTIFTRPSAGTTPWVRNFTTYADLAGTPDTSLIFTSPDGLLPVSITEDSTAATPATGGTSKYKVVYGTGTFFKIVTGFMPDLDQSAGIDIVKLWVADGMEYEVNFTGLYSRMGDNGAKSVMSFPLVPEPATMGLLAIGALGLLRRKHA